MLIDAEYKSNCLPVKSRLLLAGNNRVYHKASDRRLALMMYWEFWDMLQTEEADICVGHDDGWQ